MFGNFIRNQQVLYQQVMLSTQPVRAKLSKTVFVPSSGQQVKDQQTNIGTQTALGSTWAASRLQTGR